MQRSIICRNSTAALFAPRATAIAPLAMRPFAMRMISTGTNQQTFSSNDSMVANKAKMEKKAEDLGTEARNTYEAGKAKVEEGLEKGKDALKSAWDSKESDSLKNTARDMGNKAASAGEATKNMAANAWEKTKDVAGDATQAAKSTLEKGTEKASEMLSNSKDAIKNTAEEAKNMFSDNTADKAKDAIKNTAAQMSETARAGFKEGASELKDFGDKVKQGWDSGNKSGSNAWESAKATTADAGPNRMLWMGLIAAMAAVSYYYYANYMNRPVVAAAPSNKQKQIDEKRRI